MIDSHCVFQNSFANPFVLLISSEEDAEKKNTHLNTIVMKYYRVEKYGRIPHLMEYEINATKGIRKKETDVRRRQKKTKHIANRFIIIIIIINEESKNVENCYD